MKKGKQIAIVPWKYRQDKISFEVKATRKPGRSEAKMSFIFSDYERGSRAFSPPYLLFFVLLWKSLVTFTQQGGLQGIFSAFDFDNDESSSDFKAPAIFFHFCLFSQHEASK